MDKIEQQQLCNFIKQQFDNYSTLRTATEPFNVKGLLLYINEEQTNYIGMIEKNNMVELTFNDIDGEDPYASFSIPLEDFKPTLDYIYHHWQNNEYNKQFDQYSHKSDIIEQIHIIKQYLQSYDSEKEASNFCYVFVNNSKGIGHKIDIGNLMNSGGKKTKINSIGMIEIPVKLAFEKSKFISTHIQLPCWEIDNYPYIKKFLNLPLQANSLDELLPILRNNVPEAAKDLFYYILDDKIENKKETTPKKKI